MNNKHCHCPACTALAERYAGDPKLLTYYRKKLLIREWAGEADAVEEAYIQAHSPEAARGRALTAARLAKRI